MSRYIARYAVITLSLAVATTGADRLPWYIQFALGSLFWWAVWSVAVMHILREGRSE